MDTSLARRRQLRRDSIDAENTLWRHLRAPRFVGFQFWRRHSCGPYIVNFFCARPRLAIELGGGQHFESAAQRYDDRRTSYLVSHGIIVVRFPTDLVFRALEDVLGVIAAALGVETKE